MTESVTSSGLHDPEPSEPPFLPSHLDIAAADFSHTATSQPDFASILSPVLASSSVHVSRQPSQSSFGASLFKASAHISASERQRSADLSQVSLGSYERSPIPYIPPTVSLAAPPGESDADYPNRTESPRLPPAASDPGLAGLAQAFASSAGLSRAVASPCSPEPLHARTCSHRSLQPALRQHHEKVHLCGRCRCPAAPGSSQPPLLLHAPSSPSSPSSSSRPQLDASLPASLTPSRARRTAQPHTLTLSLPPSAKPNRPNPLATPSSPAVSLPHRFR